MTVHGLKLLVLEAVHAKENSSDETFAQVLQSEIEAFLLKVEHVMGKSIDNLAPNKKVPQEIQEAANILNECHSL